MYEGGRLLTEAQSQLSTCIRTRDDLRSYQTNKLIPFLIENPKSAAYVDMGLGKTISVLTVLDRLLTTEGVQKALIIAPKRVAVQTWPTEITDWKHTAWISYSLIRPNERAPEVASAMWAARRADPLSPNHAAGKARTAVFAMQREAAARAPQPVHIIDREHVTWLVNFHGKKWPYDCIIVDESTSFADHNSRRWQSLAQVAQRTKRIHLLSGTPAPEGILDLFAQIYLLDHGERFGRGITHFRKTYMMQNQWTRKWTPQLGAVDVIASKISDICMVMKEEDYLDITKPLVLEHPIILDDDQLTMYKEFEDELILQLPDDVEIEAVNAGVLYGKLLQFASGAVYDAEKKVHHIHDHKITALLELVEENPGEPLLVAYWFKPSLARLRKAFPKATVMDKDAACVKDWNAGKISMLLIHPQSAGHGLNLQLGPGRTLVFFDTPASLELYLQVIKRIARSGQKRLVKVIHLVTRGTLEAFAVPKLRAKESAQSAITDRLRELRAKLLPRRAA